MTSKCSRPITATRSTRPGTALKMGETIASAWDVALPDVATWSRHGDTGVRKPGTIGFSVLRGGDIVGDHTVSFCGIGERIEITHRSSSRVTYAQGALRAALPRRQAACTTCNRCWVSGGRPGRRWRRGARPDKPAMQKAPSGAFSFAGPPRRMRGSDSYRLGFQRHAVARGHRFLDGPGQRHDVGRGGPAPVHQHQRLAVMHAGGADCAPSSRTGRSASRRPASCRRAAQNQAGKTRQQFIASRTRWGS